VGKKGGSSKGTPQGSQSKGVGKKGGSSKGTPQSSAKSTPRSSTTSSGGFQSGRSSVAKPKKDPIKDYFDKIPNNFKGGKKGKDPIKDYFDKIPNNFKGGKKGKDPTITLKRQARVVPRKPDRLAALKRGKERVDRKLPPARRPSDAGKGANASDTLLGGVKRKTSLPQHVKDLMKNAQNLVNSASTGKSLLKTGKKIAYRKVGN
jgi:hypothetical protein